MRQPPDQRPSGRSAQVPYDAQEREKPKAVVGDVDLPPEEALSGGARVMVVIVVPAFAERDESEEQVVAAVVARVVTAAAEEMPERVDGEGGVVDEHRAHAATPA